MQFIQAKTAFNKLEVIDNRPFAIEKVRLLKKGFVVNVEDLYGDIKGDIYYKNREEFDKEWDIAETLDEMKNYVCFGMNDRYQE